MDNLFKSAVEFYQNKQFEKAENICLKILEVDPNNFNATNLLENVVGVQVDRQGANRTNITLRDRVDIFQTSALVMLDHRDLSQAGLNLFDSGNTNLSMIDLEKVEIVFWEDVHLLFI